MLKTKVSKAIYLCLFCFFASSFAPATPAIPLPKAGLDSKTLFATAAKVFRMPRVKLNKQATQFANNYIRKNAEDLVNIRQRSKVPFTIMDSVFVRYGLPVELKYLAVIESELKTTALSHVGALGPWQLMPETAHDLGLKITRHYDERTNYYKSTKAAALYLKDLYAQFGDWLLVLAAYNSGPKPVLTAIHKAGSRNFWALQSFLPAETRGHVKRFIATHFYFEGQGSVTTLTKAENIAYAKSLNTLAIYHPTDEVSAENESDWTITGLSYKAGAKIQKPAKAKETRDEHFKRVMKESARSLQRANKALEGLSIAWNTGQGNTNALAIFSFLFCSFKA
ncbi:MAG TPA: lytic transglycosylase domain-containing protein [Puia sp.]